MKKHTISVLTTIFLILFWSCAQNDLRPSGSIKPNAGNASNNALQQIGKTLVNAKANPPTWITYSGGQYVSTFAGGITFGTNFPHPTTVDPTGQTDGQPIPIVGQLTLIGGGGALITVDGNHFVIILQTNGKPAASDVAISFDGESFDIISDGADSGGNPTINSTYAGRVVRDHTSPTNMSVVPESFIFSTRNVTTTWLIGDFTMSNNYKITYYGPGQNYTSGTVAMTKAVNLSTNLPLAVGSGTNLTYHITSDGNFYTVAGTLVIGTTSYTISQLVPSAR